MWFTVISGKIKAAEKGWITCPICHRKLQRVAPDTRAENLPIWCPRCKTEYTVSIPTRDRSATTPESMNL